MKKIIRSFFILLSVFYVNFSAAQIPDHFKEVDQTLWVVGDLTSVVDGWKELGFDQMMDFGTVKVNLETSRKKAKVKMVKANLGGAYITWIQPLKSKSVFKDFHNGYGDGAMSLVHRLQDQNAAKAEIKRLANIGVDVMEKLTIHTGQGDFHYYLMNTTEKGKYILGYTFGSDPIPKSLPASNRHQMKLSQYAFAAKSIQAASDYWHSIGFPEISVTHPELRDLKYNGKPAEFEMILGWQRHGTVAYEWCVPVKPPTVYEDHISKHGEGIQHIAFSVRDMDEVIRDYESKGYAISQSGAWGEKGKPGSGRFAYVDLESAGGVTMELLWNYE